MAELQEPHLQPFSPSPIKSVGSEFKTTVLNRVGSPIPWIKEGKWGISGLIEGQRRSSLGSGALLKSETLGACESTFPSEALPSVSFPGTLLGCGFFDHGVNQDRGGHGKQEGKIQLSFAVCPESVIKPTPEQQWDRLPQHEP